MKQDLGIRPDGALATGQVTTALRPLLGRAPLSRRNLLTHTEELANAAWVKTDPSGFGAGPKTVADAVAARFDGQMRASSITESTLNEFQVIYQSFIGLTGGQAGTNFLFSVDVKPNGRTQCAVGVSWTAVTRVEQATWIVVDLLSGLQAGKKIPGSANHDSQLVGVLSLADGWLRITVRLRRLTSGTVHSIPIIGPASGGTASYQGNGTSGILVARLQVEREITTGVTSAYQRVTGTVDMTEDGFVSYPFIRNDLSDDVLVTTLPQAVAGDLVIAGRNGTWIEPVSIAANSNLSLGPAGLVPTTGLLRGTGDAVGWSIFNKTLTAAERERLIRFYRRRGAKGLLTVGGPELAVNGNFATDTGWTKSGAGSTITFNNPGYTIASVTANASLAQQIFGLVSGRAYRVSVVLAANNGTVNSIRARLGFGVGNIEYGINVLQPANFVGEWVSIFRCGEVTSHPNGIWLMLTTAATGVSATISSISIREMRPEEEW